MRLKNFKKIVVESGGEEDKGDGVPSMSMAVSLLFSPGRSFK